MVEVVGPWLRVLTGAGRKELQEAGEPGRENGRTGNSRSNLSPGALSSLEKGEQSFYVSAVWPPCRHRCRYRECYLSLWAVVVVVGYSPRRLPSSFSPPPSFPSPPYPISTSFNQLLFNYPFFSFPSFPPLYLLQPTFIQLPLLFLPLITPSLPPSTNFYSTTPSFPSPHLIPPLYLLQPTFIQLPLLFLPLITPSLPPSTNFNSTTPSFPTPPYPLSTSFNQLLFNYPAS